MQEDSSKAGARLLYVSAIALILIVLYSAAFTSEAQREMSSQEDVVNSEGSPVVEALVYPATREGEGSGIPGLSCPVDLPIDASQIRSHAGEGIEYWRAFSESGSREVARDLLLSLQEGGNKLVRADFLDLSGEAWGCAVLTPDEESLIISLIPERLGSPRNADNKLAISVIRIAKPEFE
jgi:hypothetical protein